MHGPEYNEIIRSHLRTAYLLSDEKIDSVLPRFLETLVSLTNKLDTLAKTDAKHEEISKAGHALKGALLSLGLKKLADRAYLVEQYGISPSPNVDYRTIITELIREISKIC